MAVGCFSPDNEISVGEQTSSSATKIINSADSAERGSLLVKFNEEGTRSLAGGITRNSGEISTNIALLNEALREIEAISIEPLFPINPKHIERARKAGLHRWYVVRFDNDKELEKAAEAISKIEEVEIVQYNSYLTHQPSKAIYDESPQAESRLSVSEVNDPGFSKQWHYYSSEANKVHEAQIAGMDINVKDAWRYCSGDSSIVVAVIDEGVDYTHEDLAANMWVNNGEIPNNKIDDDGNGFIDDVHGFNHYTGGEISWDKAGDSGHGTHVAGTIAAVNQNGKGLCGVAGGDGSGNGVRIMSSQLFSGKSKGTAEVSARAFHYAADNGAVIAQCSWGYDGGTMKSDKDYKTRAGAEYDGILYFQSAKNSNVIDGGLVIFAAGNDSLSISSYPGAYRTLVSVASVGCDGLPAYYTNYKAGVNISAPGGDTKNHGKGGGVYSTLPKNKYGYMQGTSMACPHVSGVAALGLSYAKQLGKTFSLEEFTAMLLLSVDNIDNDIQASPIFSAHYTGNMGSGRIDALKMLMNVEGTPCIDVPQGNYFEVDLRKYFGDGDLNLSIRSVSMSEEDKSRLGVTNGPKVFSNKLIITCENTGHGFIEVETLIGGSNAGSDNATGSRVTTKRFAIIVRKNHTLNGGWL